jgi:hypothetical protein
MELVKTTTPGGCDNPACVRYLTDTLQYLQLCFIKQHMDAATGEVDPWKHLSPGPQGSSDVS